MILGGPKYFPKDFGWCFKKPEKMLICFDIWLDFGGGEVDGSSQNDLKIAKNELEITTIFHENSKMIDFRPCQGCWGDPKYFPGDFRK